MLYLTDAVDEYCLQALPEYEGKKFQNVAISKGRIRVFRRGREGQEELGEHAREL